MSRKLRLLLLSMVLIMPLLLPVNIQASDSISEARAERIAVQDAGTSISDAVALETEDEGNYYEVSFYKKKNSDTYTHYVYRINQESGDIVRKNHRDYSVISRSTAEDIALDDAGYDKDDVHNLDSDLEDDGDELVWNVSFTADRYDRYYDDDDDYYYDRYYNDRYYYGDYYYGDYYYDGYYGTIYGTYYTPYYYGGRYYRSDYDDDYWYDRDYSYKINAINKHIIERDRDRY